MFPRTLSESIVVLLSACATEPTPSPSPWAPVLQEVSTAHHASVAWAACGSPCTATVDVPAEDSLLSLLDDLDAACRDAGCRASLVSVDRDGRVAQLALRQTQPVGYRVLGAP